MSLSDVGALIGAVLGPVGFAVALLAYFRDSPRLWVSVTMDMRVANSPIYDEKNRYVVVTVSNIGRRPEFITDVGLVFPDGQNSVLSDTFFNPNESAEGAQPRKYLAEQSTIAQLDAQWPGIKAFVRTAAGRQYRSYFFSKPKLGHAVGFFSRQKLRLQTRLRHRWAFKPRLLH